MAKNIALVLNLDGAEDRLAHFAEQASRAEVAFERLPAVDGRKMSAREISNATDKAAIYPLAPSEIACILSHRRAWARIVESRAPWGVVFEDDVCLSAQTGRLIRSLPPYRSEPTIIKLETYGSQSVALGVKQIAFAGRTLQPLRGVAIGSAGYAITRSACLKLLAEEPRYALPSDLYLFSNRLGSFRKATVFVMNPAPVIQADRLEEKRALFVSLLHRGKQMQPRPTALKLFMREIFRLREARGRRLVRRSVPHRAIQAGFAGFLHVKSFF
jgi:glycosyl transferase family 25